MSETAQPPTPDGIPIIGHGMAFSRNPIDAMEQWATHGDIVRIRFFGSSLYMVTGPEYIKDILVHNSQQFTIGSRQQETFQGIEDHAMTTATGDRWKRLRRAAHPAFTRDRIEQYCDHMTAVTTRFVDNWTHGNEVDLHAEMRLLTVQLLGETLFREDLRGQEDVILEATDAFIDRTNFRRPGQMLPGWIPTPTEYRFRQSVSRLNDLVDELVANRRREGETNTDNVCSVLFDAHENGTLTMEEVHHNLVAFLLAGHESPAGALTRVWYLLDGHPDIREALRNEVDRVVDGDRPTADAYDDLTVTKNVVREALRLYPPTTGINRQATEPVTLGEYEFPAGAKFFIPQWVPHRDGRFWEEPETFDPSRWNRETDRPEYAYFPFSGGPRHCIGADFARYELVLAVATIIDRVELELNAPDSLSFVPSIQLRPESDIRAVVRQ